MSEPAVDQGAIQPNGFLVALSSDWMVAHASANIIEFVGKPADVIIGHHVNSLLCPDAVHALRNRLALLRGVDAIERMFRCPLLDDERMFDIALHHSEDLVIVEAQPSTEQLYGDATGTLRGMIARLDEATDMAGFLNEGARQIRALTGFERVMTLKVTSGGSEEVVGESAKSGIGNLLGHRFSPSDIPGQACGPSRRSLLRVVIDIDAAPVPIISMPGEHGTPFDMSLAVLRSASPLHIKTLRDKGVRASMSIAIIVEGALWGVIACHHASPRCTSFERRSVAELFVQMFSMRLEIREIKILLETERRDRAGSF